MIAERAMRRRKGIWRLSSAPPWVGRQRQACRGGPHQSGNFTLPVTVTLSLVFRQRMARTKNIKPGQDRGASTHKHYQEQSAEVVRHRAFLPKLSHFGLRIRSSRYGLPWRFARAQNISAASLRQVGQALSPAQTTRLLNRRFQPLLPAIYIAIEASPDRRHDLDRDVYPVMAMGKRLFGRLPEELQRLHGLCVSEAGSSGLTRTG